MWCSTRASANAIDVRTVKNSCRCPATSTFQTYSGVFSQHLTRTLDKVLSWLGNTACSCVWLGGSLGYLNKPILQCRALRSADDQLLWPGSPRSIQLVENETGNWRNTGRSAIPCCFAYPVIMCIVLMICTIRIMLLFRICLIRLWGSLKQLLQPVILQARPITMSWDLLGSWLAETLMAGRTVAVAMRKLLRFTFFGF